MYLRNLRYFAYAGLSCAVLAPLYGHAQSGFSDPATQADIEYVWFSIGTDGENLPEGAGTAAGGKPLYDAHCASCHGLEGEGTLAQQLVGGIGSLDSDMPVKTVGSYWPYATTLFNYLRRAMPYTAPMSLTNDDYYAITAYLLYRNEIIGQHTVVDATSLANIRMPNAEGFVSAYPRVPEAYDYIDKK